MDELSGSGRMPHPSLRLDLTGQPRLVDGKLGKALALDGNAQFLSVDRQGDACLGNLDLCRHGVLVSAWLRPGQLREGMDFLSTGANGITARYVGGQLKVGRLILECS